MYDSFADAVRDLGVVSYSTARRRARKEGWSKSDAMCIPPYQTRDNLFIAGKSYGKLTLIKQVESIKRNAAWLCQCACGNQKVILKKNILKKKKPTQSCGCIQKTTAKFKLRRSE